MKLFSFFFPWIPLLEYVALYSFGLEFYLFSHCSCIWTIKYRLSFDTDSVILVLMALITYWNKKKNTLCERCTVLYWRSVTKNTSVHAVNNQLLLEDCCKSLKIWQSLWLLNDCFELFVLVPILYKPCHETATEHLSDFIERPSSSDFKILLNLWGIPDPKRGMHSWLFDFFPSTQMALWDFQLVDAIPFFFFFRNLSIVREL